MQNNEVDSGTENGLVGAVKEERDEPLLRGEGDQTEERTRQMGSATSPGGARAAGGSERTAGLRREDGRGKKTRGGYASFTLCVALPTMKLCIHHVCVLALALAR